MRPQATTRKVYFFRVYAGLDDAGEPLEFPARKPLAAVAKLDFDEGENYLEDALGNATCCWVDKLDRVPLKVRLANVRRVDLPQVEKKGRVGPLRLTADSGIAEQTHIIFFENNIVGCLYNHYGPRLSRFARYLTEKCPNECTSVRFDPLLRRDVLEQLDSFGSIRSFELRVRRSALEELKQIDEDLYSAFHAAAELGRAERVTVVLQPEPYQRHNLNNEMLGRVKRLFTRAPVEEVADRFVISGMREDGDRVEELDLLRDHLTSEEQVVLLDGRTRAVDDSSAYEAVARAYKNLRQDLARAAAVWIPRA